jgi:hypothetical protein
VYEQGSFYDLPSVLRWRWLYQSFMPVFNYHFALRYAQFAAHILTPLHNHLIKLRGMWRVLRFMQCQLMPYLTLPDTRWNELDIFDVLTPSIATTHSPSEVYGWLEEAHCHRIRVTDWCPTSFVGYVKE